MNIRVPAELRNRIRLNAAANRRSVNSEIVHYLDQALRAEEAATTGEGLVATAPAAVSRTGALQGANPITQAE